MERERGKGAGVWREGKGRRVCVEKISVGGTCDGHMIHKPSELSLQASPVHNNNNYDYDFRVCLRGYYFRKWVYKYVCVPMCRQSVLVLNRCFPMHSRQE